jgi:hypothetical protein
MYTRNIAAARSWVQSQIDFSNILNSLEVKDEATITLDGSIAKNVFESTSIKLRDTKRDFENSELEFQDGPQGSETKFINMLTPIRIS